MNENDWNIVELHSINDNYNTNNIEKDDFTIIYNNNNNENNYENKQNKNEFSLQNKIQNNPEKENETSIFFEESNTDSNKISKLNYKNNIENEYAKMEIINEIFSFSGTNNNNKSNYLNKTEEYKSNGHFNFLELIRKTNNANTENFFFYSAILSASVFYFLSLERCQLENEFQCWKLFYPKIKTLAFECFLASLIISVLYANLIIFNKKIFTKKSFILYISHFILFHVDDGIDFTGNHGGYNRLFLNVFVIVFLLITLIIYCCYKIAKLVFTCAQRKIEETFDIEFFKCNFENCENEKNNENNFLKKFNKMKLTIAAILVFLIFCILHFYTSIKIKLTSTCDDWDKGFKNSKLNQEANCYIEKPTFCYNEFFDGVFDFSKFLSACEFQKIHNIEVVNKFYNNSNEFVEFPDTRKISIENKDSLSIQLNVQKQLKFISAKDFLNALKANKTKSFVYLNRTDPDANKHHFIYDIEYNEDLVNEAERKRSVFKTKFFIKENKEIFDLQEYEEYLIDKKLFHKMYNNETLNKLEIKSSEKINNLKNKKDSNNNINNSINKTSNLQNEQHQQQEHPDYSSENTFIEFINSKTEKTLSSLFLKNEVLTENIIFIFLDTLSRQQFKRKLPKAFNYLSSLYKNKSSSHETFQFLKYHATQASTDMTMRPIFLGTDPLQKNETVKAFVHEYFQEKGFISGHSQNQCLNFEISFDKREPQRKFKWKDYDFEFYSLFCDPAYVEHGKETAFRHGPYSFFRKCLYGKDTFRYVFDWGRKFFKDVYAKQRKYLGLSFIDGHEWTNESVKYLDNSLFSFLSESLENDFENVNKDNENQKVNKDNVKDNETTENLNFFQNKSLKKEKNKNSSFNENTVVVLLSDHGLHMNGPSLLLNFEDVEKEKLLPVFDVILPRNLADSYLGKALELNENRIIGGYDIHNFFKTLAGSLDFSLYGEQPFKVMPDARGCVNLGVPEYNCLCKKVGN